MGILSRLFGSRKTSTEGVKFPIPIIESRSPKIEMQSFNSDSSYDSNQDIIDGLEFGATLQLQTPLEVLIHHGEIFYGPPSQAPQYGEWKDGFSPDGIWVFKSKSFEQLISETGGNSEIAKILDDKNVGGTHASDIGQVIPQNYLPFLIEFRKIVESNVPIKTQIKLIKNLKSISPQFASIIRKLNKNYQGFPSRFFIMKLCEIPGVGIKTATSLFNAGFLSISDLKNLPAERLVSIQGIGPSTAKKISDFVTNLVR